MDRARQIAAVVAQYSTQVQHDQLVFPDLARRRTRMRQRGAWPGSHDRFKGFSGRSFPAHPVANLRSDFKFGDSRPNQANGLFHDLGAQSRGVPDSVNFKGVFDGAEAFDQAINGNPFYGLPPAAFLSAFQPAKVSREGATATLWRFLFRRCSPTASRSEPLWIRARIPRVSSLAWTVNLPSVNSVADVASTSSAPESPKIRKVIDIGQVRFEQRADAGVHPASAEEALDGLLCWSA